MTKPAAGVLSGYGFEDIVQRGIECAFGASTDAGQERRRVSFAPSAGKAPFQLRASLSRHEPQMNRAQL